MKIYFVRHGETEWNRIGKIQGMTDNPLNDTGKAEAEKAAAALLYTKFDKCYCSPLLRAKQTAGYIMKNRSCPVVYEDLLHEMSFGIAEGINLDELESNANLYNFLKAPDKFEAFEGGESFDDVKRRCRDFLDKMCENETDSENILAVCHGGVIRSVISIIKDVPLKDFWGGPVQRNCALTIVSCENGKWKVEKEGLDIANE